MSDEQSQARFAHIGGQYLVPGLDGKPLNQLVWQHEQQWLAPVNERLCYLVFPDGPEKFVAVRVFRRSTLEKTNPGKRMETVLGEFSEWEKAIEACTRDYEENQ